MPNILSKIKLPNSTTAYDLAVNWDNIRDKPNLPSILNFSVLNMGQIQYDTDQKVYYVPYDFTNASRPQDDFQSYSFLQIQLVWWTPLEIINSFNGFNILAVKKPNSATFEQFFTYNNKLYKIEVTFGMTTRSIKAAKFYIQPVEDRDKYDESTGTLEFIKAGRLIRFLIGITSYYCEDNMTWKEFFNSVEYNTQNLTIEDLPSGESLDNVIIGEHTYTAAE